MTPAIKYLLECSNKTPPPIVNTEEEVVEWLLELLEAAEQRIEVIHIMSSKAPRDYKQREMLDD